MLLKRFYLAIVAFVCLLAYSPFAVSVFEGINSENKYLKVDFLDETLDLSPLHFENCQPAIQLEKQFFLVSCHNKKMDTQNDYGLRLFLIEMIKRVPVIRFKSHGAGDSYYLRLSVFKTANMSDPLIILAEAGAEFSYGISVYLLDKLQMRYIGELNTTVNEDNIPGSAVPFVEIRKKGKLLTFTFTKDLLMSQDDGEYSIVSKNLITYIYDGKGQLRKDEKSKDKVVDK